MNDISIDVITVTFNNIAGLKKTYNSVSCQTYSHYSWLIIDGGSSDGTVEFVNKIKNELSNNIRIEFISEADAGIYDAMNKGIDLAQSDYLIFINAGDELATRFTLEKVNKQIISLPDLIYGNFYRESKLGKFIPVKAKPLWYIYHSLPTSHQAIFYKTEHAKNIKYKLKYSICGDYYLTSQIIFNNQLMSNNNVLLLSDYISKFEYAGTSRNNLQQLYKEAETIQKEELNLPWLWRKLSYIFKYMRNLFL
jgi:putative colanic acid biosynthesis glycosyltransferase